MRRLVCDFVVRMQRMSGYLVSMHIYCILFYVLSIFQGVVLILGSLFGILASISLRNIREANKEVTFVVDNTEPMLETKSHTDNYTHRTTDSVLRNDSEKKLEYCNGIEERNKLMQPTSFQCNGFGNHDSIH